jgi:GDPmannose 4,6-dehydratase
MKKAFITGISGMDGSHLTELLLDKGYEVSGLIRRASTFNDERIRHIKNDNLRLFHGDSTDACCIRSILDKVQPDEVYNLSSPSHVAESFLTPLYSMQATGMGTLILLDAIKEVNPKIKFYNAATSELFGSTKIIPQNEDTPFNICSPYAAAKAYSYHITKNYRNSYNLHASNGILFNHTSERQLPTFISRKITYGISQILAGKQDVLTLGNLYSLRDMGYSPNYCDAMWRILQHSEPLDIIVATNESYTIKQFVEEAFKNIDIDLQWRGSGLDEEAFDPKTNKLWVKIDPAYFRPQEVDYLKGDYSLAKEILGWQPTITFKEIINTMMKHDLKEAGISL